MSLLLKISFSWLLLTLLSGCMTFSVEGDLPKTPDSTTASQVFHGSLYGFKWSAFPVEKCENQKGVSRVRYHTNAAFLVVSVLSLGAYVPQNVTWWCDGADTSLSQDNEDDDEYRPEGS